MDGGGAQAAARAPTPNEDDAAGDGGALPPLRAEDWAYLGEGKIHLVCHYQGDDERFHGSVLRLIKVRHHGDKKGKYDPADEKRFVQRVMEPALGDHFVDSGTSLPASPSFLQALADRVRPHRPEGRRVVDVDVGLPTVERLKDSTRFFPPFHRSGHEVHRHHRLQGPTVTVEIKPKAGYLSRSYLVEPAHRIKHSVSRFAIMQRYRRHQQVTEAVEPEWGKLERLQLDYCPVDFFSGEGHRVHRALHALLHNPQVYGRGGRSDVAVAREAAAHLFSSALSSATAANGNEEEEEEEEDATAASRNSDEEENDPLAHLASVLTRVLVAEPVLGRILALQHYDVLDVEGAHLVFERLTALCGGDQDEAMRLLDKEMRALEPPTWSEAEREARHARLRELEGVLAMPSQGHHDGDGDEVLDAKRAEAAAAVSELGKEECLMLLEKWLIAFGAVDVSLMVALRRFDSHEGRHHDHRLQSPELPGILTYYHDEVSEITQAAAGGGNGSSKEEARHVHVAYNIQVVDVGPKPPTKILLRRELEAGIIQGATAAMATMKEGNNGEGTEG